MTNPHRVQLPRGAALKATAKAFGVSIEEIKSEAKSEFIVEARTVAAILLRDFYGLTAGAISHAINRDRTSVYSMFDRFDCKKTSSLADKYAAAARMLSEFDKNRGTAAISFPPRGLLRPGPENPPAAKFEACDGVSA